MDPLTAKGSVLLLVGGNWRAMGSSGETLVVSLGSYWALHHLHKGAEGGGWEETASPRVGCPDAK